MPAGGEALALHVAARPSQQLGWPDSAAFTRSNDVEAAGGLRTTDGGSEDGVDERSADGSCSPGATSTVARWEGLVRGIMLDARISRAYTRVHGEYRIREAKKLILVYMLIIVVMLASAWFRQLPIFESMIRGAMSTVNAFLYMCITLAANDKFLFWADDIYTAFIAFNVVGLSYLTRASSWGGIPFVVVSMFISELPAQHNTLIIIVHAIAAPAVELVVLGAQRFSVANLLAVLLLLVIIITSDTVAATIVFDRNASHRAIFRMLFLKLAGRTTAFKEENRFIFAAACTALYGTYRLRATGFTLRLTPGARPNLDFDSIVDNVYKTHILPAVPWANISALMTSAPPNAPRAHASPDGPREPAAPGLRRSSSVESVLALKDFAPTRVPMSPRDLRGSVPFDWIMAQSPSTPGLIDHVYSRRSPLKPTLRLQVRIPEQHEPGGAHEAWALRRVDELRWMPREDYILSKYRENYTMTMNLASVFRLHNQTFSIWTHLLPAFLLPVAYCVLLSEVLPRMPADFRLVSNFATALTTMQLFVSAAAHTFYNQSTQAYRFWWKLDFVFICIGIYSYCFRFGYAMLLCDGAQRRAEFYLICAAVCVASLMVTLFHAKEAFRILGMVLVFVVCNVVPQLTMVLQGNVGLRAPIFRSAAGSYASFGIALFFFVTKLPERIGGGRFDVLVNSHQIWHVGIAGAHMVDAIYMPHLISRLPVDAICS